MEKFTIEQVGLICVFDTSSRDKLIEDLREALPDTDDPDMAELMRGVVDRLEAMTDAEFDALGLIEPDYDYDEETEG